VDLDRCVPVLGTYEGTQEWACYAPIVAIGVEAALSPAAFEASRRLIAFRPCIFRHGWPESCISQALVPNPIIAQLGVLLPNSEA
jgi:hypothetical protein